MLKFESVVNDVTLLLLASVMKSLFPSLSNSSPSILSISADTSAVVEEVEVVVSYATSRLSLYITGSAVLVV